MHSSLLRPSLFAFVLAGMSVNAIPTETPATFVMKGCQPDTQHKISSQMINGTELAVYQCTHAVSGARAAPLSSRGTWSLCGAECDTQCFGSAGQGPNEGDCAVVSNELVNDNFDIPAGNDVAFIYGSCHATFSNRASVDMSYCGTDGAAITTYMAGACNAAHGAAGGQCDFQNDLGLAFWTVGHT